MNSYAPVTNMLRTTQRPTRSFIVSDPAKLTYFARANAVRAGTGGTWGALSGLSEAMPSHSEASADNTAVAGSFQTIGDLFGRIGQSLLGSTPTTPVIQQAPPDMTGMHIAIGVAAAGVGAFIAWKLAKKYG